MAKKYGRKRVLIEGEIVIDEAAAEHYHGVAVMRTIHIEILVLLIAAFTYACNPDKPVPGPVPDPDPNASITLDELNDMEDYTEGMIVDVRYYNEKQVEKIVLNDLEYKAIPSIDLMNPGYYRIEIYFYPSSSIEPVVIRLVVLDPERGNTEWGLAPWTPRGVAIENLEQQEISLIYPRNIPQGSDIPLIVVVAGELTRSTTSLEASLGKSDFLIKRGVGSQWTSSGDPSSETLVIDQRNFPIQTGVISEPPVSLEGSLAEDTRILTGDYVHIPADLTVPSGITLTVEEGAYVTLAPGINIYNEGTILIQGTEKAPASFTCSNPDSYWGGVIGETDGNRLEASHAIFSRSGYHAGGDYDWGHAHRQALFYCDMGSLVLEHCYMIDHIGQIIYSTSASLDLDYCLVQRAKTGGQQNASQVSVNHSVFTDFPDDSDTYRDNDNDGLYLVECIADLSNSFFMYAKDDGLDSGGGAYPGDVTVRQCRFESNFHEGAALSGGNSTGKNQRFYSCIFIDCGQGLELGFSSREHQVLVDSCLFQRNGIGIRYGDNYTYLNKGYISVSNSESIENLSYDVWNMDREDWAADTFNMEFDNVWVTKPNPMYPQLKIMD